MIIALDEAIPFWKEAFSNLGELCPFSGRSLKPEEIRHADALIVRSVTPVDASLLEGSSVQFVASATAGINHIDQEYLKARGIYFCYAPGCNADSVSEYIITALYATASRRQWDLPKKSLAVIGVGNVGSRVAKKTRALGMKVLLCDPPLRDSTGDPQYLSFDDVLGADILTFHVPLVSEGPYPTWHMLNRKTLDRLLPTQFLLNSARGAVFDNRELKSALQDGRIEGAVLDVWEGEPRIDYALLDSVDIGTPHIAGGGLDGKIRAVEMAREGLCRFFAIQSPWNTDSIYAPPRLIRAEGGTEGQNAVLSLLLQALNILKYDAGLRALRSIPETQAVSGFDRLHGDGMPRPEFRHFTVDLSGQNGNLAETLTTLGFSVEESKP